MALPAPNLDDRRFQDLVDDAKRLVQQRCPEWTDHNVSDPGVTLIEAVAYMADQVIYRLNRVPDRHYVKLLELIGVRLFPPAAATVPVTFYLTAPQSQPVQIPAGTEVATVRTETDEAIVFTTDDELVIVPTAYARAATTADGASLVDRTSELEREKSFAAFELKPKPGNAILVGLREPVPSCALSLRMRCTIEGVGVDPTRPPLVWEAWTGEDWSPCEVDSDSTGGLNRDGEIVIHVPRGHVASLVEGQRAGWIRGRVIAADEGVPPYSASPRIHGIAAATIGGTVGATNGQPIRNEVVGTGNGVPGQRFALKHRPVVAGPEPVTVSVSEGDGWSTWHQVDDFSGSDENDRAFVLDGTLGEIVFGPGVREPDGSIRQHGGIPAKGAQVRVDVYRTGGGRQGNVATGTIRTLRTTIPSVRSEVKNRKPAAGGVDGEDIGNAKLRAPISLRSRGRAVTTEDYEQIAREAAPEIARVKAIPATEGPDAGSVRVLVVPSGVADGGRLRFEQLVPRDETLARITARLDECRVIGTRLVVEPPAYRGVTVVAKLKPRARANPTRLRDEALAALYAYLNPIGGGPDGTGWPFGRPVQIGEIYGVLQGLPGTGIVEDVRLFGADPITGQRGQAAQRIDLDPLSLVFSFEHQLLVEGA